MHISQRQITIGLLGLLIAGVIAIITADISAGAVTTLTYIDAAAGGLFGVMLWATLRGWPHTPLVLIALITLLAGGALPEPFVTQEFSSATLIPPIVALALTSARWIAASAASTLALLIARAGGEGVYTEPVGLVIYLICIGGLILARQVAAGASQLAERARAEAEQAARALQDANENLERRVAERTAEQLRLLSENERQRAAILELSAPVLPIGDGQIVIPLVGALDRSRIELIGAEVLQAIARARARSLIIDITGVPAVDEPIARGLLEVVQAARLLGAEATLVGVRAEVARAIVGLGLDLSDVQVASDLQSALGRT